MYEVTINHKTGTKTYKVYTKEEADTNNITYIINVSDHIDNYKVKNFIRSLKRIKFRQF